MNVRECRIYIERLYNKKTFIDDSDNSRNWVRHRAGVQAASECANDVSGLIREIEKKECECGNSGCPMGREV